MSRTTTKPAPPPQDVSENIGFSTDCHARAFGGVLQPIVDIQARIRFREDQERAAIVVSGVPRPRTLQILENVLQLPSFEGVHQQHLRMDLHREDGSRWHHSYGLAAAVAMVSSLSRRPVPAQHLFIGDLDLHGHIRDVAPWIVDALNGAIE
ncbi:MAG TPA: hypothetical protein VHS31_08920, partial [Tepidisphaeraceae bacterium]|nr:hypothetical protein [Tepidisphaeraceae bacterium]